MINNIINHIREKIRGNRKGRKEIEENKREKEEIGGDERE